MTRINSAINVEYLTDEHLLAEHREIKRLPTVFIKALSSGALSRIPSDFRLGTGHVTFFLNKQLFLYKRYLRIYTECRARGFDVENYEPNWLTIRELLIKQGCWQDYKPTDIELALLKDRIALRIADSKKAFFHYKSKPIFKDQAINLLTTGKL